MQTKLQWQEAYQQLPGDREGHLGGFQKGAMSDSFGGDGFVHFLDCGDSFKIICICQLYSLSAVYCMSFEPLNIVKI